MEKLVAHRERPIPSLIDAGAGIPAPLEAIFQMMVAKDPGQRYQSMTSVAADLQRFLEGATPRAVSRAYSPVIVEHPALPNSRAARKRQTIAMSIGGIAVLLVMIAGGWLVANTDWRKALQPVITGQRTGAGDSSEVVQSKTSSRRYEDLRPVLLPTAVEDEVTERLSISRGAVAFGELFMRPRPLPRPRNQWQSQSAGGGNRVCRTPGASC